MPALRLNQLTDGRIRLAPPLSSDDAIAVDLLQAPDDIGERLVRRPLERQDLNIVVIEAKVVTVALESRIANLKVHKSIETQADRVRFVGRIVEQAPEETKRCVLAERLELDHIVQLNDQA